MGADLSGEIESLRELTSKDLKTRYRELFGEESPSSNRLHLFRRIAWRLQANAQGDLTEQARQRASQLAQEPSLRLRAPRQFWDTVAKPVENLALRDPRLPALGAVLKRTYHGKTIEVTIVQEGFEYNGNVTRR